MTAESQPAGDPTIAVRLRLGAATELRVLADTYSGRRLLHIREFVLTDDNSFAPTPKGVAVDINCIGQVLDAVSELREAGTKVGVIASVSIGTTKEVRFSIAEWKGTTKADIRMWFQKPGSADFHAGKGVRFNLSLLPDLERGLELLEQQP